MPGYDQKRIAHLEERLAEHSIPASSSVLSELEMLADLYLQADSYVPALETIECLLSRPEARTLSAAKRAVLESKAISCRLARGDCQSALAHCQELLRDDVRLAGPIRCRIELQSAEALFRLGRIDECRLAGERALELADRHADVNMSAHAINLLGRAAYRAGDLVRARDLYEQALALFRRVGDEASTAHIRNNLGLIHKNLCEWESATNHLLAALEIHRANGNFAETANPLMNLGIVYQKSGDWTRAAECYAQAQRVYTQVADHMRLAVTGIGLGNLARLERRFGDAEEHLLGALERARSHQARREEVLALEFLGELEQDRDRPEAAMTRYRDALRLAEQFAPAGDLVVEVERRRAQSLLALGRLDEANQACVRARRLAESIGDRLEHGVTYRVGAAIASAQGHAREAVESWRQAVVLLEPCRERLELGRALLDLGRAVSDPAESRRHLIRAAALLGELPSPYWYEQAQAVIQSALGVERTPVPERPTSANGRRLRAPGLVACSQAMRRVETLARRAASTELSVLITGETGTGKELVARTIHSLSGRAEGPFLAVNCGALRADLALSQLFGHRKGAFTGAHQDGVGLVEAAHTGTLFLDEIGELPADVQVTLLRFLESGEYLRLGETQVRRADVRVIAATNRELRGPEAEKLFRRDLLFRLNEIEIRVPALRERAEDIVPLARHFVAFYGGLEGPRLGPESEAMLFTHPWVGNVRELENVMKRVAALHSGDELVDATALMPFLASPGPMSAMPERNGDDERQAILSALVEARGNKSRAAEVLGVSRKTLYARIRRLRLDA